MLKTQFSSKVDLTRFGNELFNWCLFLLTVMRDSVISKSAPIGADLDLTISLRSTVRMNKEAPIGADSFYDNERYCQKSKNQKSAPIGASSF